MTVANTLTDVTAWLESRGYTVEAVTDEPASPTTPTPPAAVAPVAEKPRRHRGWVKLREHVYICPICGTGRENCQQGNTWVTRWYLPDGTTRQLKHTPPCVVGPRTEAYLGKHAQAITAARAIATEEPTP